MIRPRNSTRWLRCLQPRTKKKKASDHAETRLEQFVNAYNGDDEESVATKLNDKA